VEGDAKIMDFRGKYEFLSNFYPCQVELDDEVYPSVEHAFQAAKTDDFEWREKIRLAGSARMAKVIGSKVQLRSNWEDIKVWLMLELLREKFMDRSLANMLLETGDAELVEDNNWHDEFWGMCNGRGKNQLGKLLMQVRGELRGNIS
jgi:hypothetical protein